MKMTFAKGVHAIDVIPACAVFLLLALSAIAADVKSYDLDMDGPLKLHTWSPYPSRVDVYITGPQLGFDPLFTWLVLHGLTCDYSTTNNSDISMLISALDKDDLDHRLDNISWTKGYTYHLLLFQDTNHTVMHYRVFEPVIKDETNANVLAIYPMTHSHYVYYNNQIGLWLHERVKIPPKTTSSVSLVGSNSVPASANTTTIITDSSRRTEKPQRD